jgi:hypothetical protein
MKKYKCEPFLCEKTLVEVQSAKQISKEDCQRHAKEFCDCRKKKFKDEAFAYLPHVDLWVDENGKVSYVDKEGKLLDDAPTPTQLMVTQGLKKNLEKHTRQVLTKLQRRIKRR